VSLRHRFMRLRVAAETLRDCARAARLAWRTRPTTWHVDRRSGCQAVRWGESTGLSGAHYGDVILLCGRGPIRDRLCDALAARLGCAL